MNLSLFVLLAVFASTVSADFTGSAAELFVTEVSGRFSNEQSLNQIKEEGYKSKQLFMNAAVYPLNNLPALNSDFTVYIEEWTEEKLVRQQIFAVKGEGDIFEIEPYDFVHPESFVPGTFNISSLESLTMNDLNYREECKIYFVRTGETTLVADWPFCTDSVAVKLMITSSCNSMATFVYNKQLPLSSSKMPYILVKVENFPVPASIMPDYELYKSLCNY